jgi:hypothetical protein
MPTCRLGSKLRQKRPVADTNGIYELAILGAATPEERATLTATLTDIVSDFGLTLGDDVVVHNAATLGERHKPAAFACAYFGGNAQQDLEAAQDLIRASAPIIPTIAAGADFNAHIPRFSSPSMG